MNLKWIIKKNYKWLFEIVSHVPKSAWILFCMSKQCIVQLGYYILHHYQVISFVKFAEEKVHETITIKKIPWRLSAARVEEDPL